MKKRNWLAAMAAFSLLFTGCTVNIYTSDKADASKQVSPASSMEQESTEASSISTPNTNSKDRETAKNKETKQQKEESDAVLTESSSLEEHSQQAFTNIDLTITKGSLYVRTGSEFSIVKKDGKSAKYDIIDNTLYFSDERSNDIVLTLPEKSTYESLHITAKSGNISAELPLILNSVTLEVEEGEVSIADATISNESSITIHSGSVYLSGSLGDAVSADCEKGHLSLDSSDSVTDYNYVLKASNASIRLDDKKYEKNTEQQIDNGAARTMSLTCSFGDISVEF